MKPCKDAFKKFPSAALSRYLPRHIVSRPLITCQVSGETVVEPNSYIAGFLTHVLMFGTAAVTKSLVIVFPRKAQKARNGDREWRFVVASISRRLVLSLLRTKALLAYGRVHRLEDSSCPDHF